MQGFTQAEVQAAYTAWVTDTLYSGEVEAIEIYDDANNLDAVATGAANRQIQETLKLGRKLLSESRLVFGRKFMNFPQSQSIENADGETIVVPAGYIAGNEYFRVVGLRRVDDLISLSEAANEAGITVQAISQAVDSGRLHGYVNPNEPNPQRRRRVSRAEVRKVWPGNH